jgi:type II secretory pathway predicted ATPase ExeA
MYRSYFGLREAPFGTNPDPHFLYVMPHVRETLACLQYGIADRKGFVVLTGEVGTGKTTLLRTVLDTFSKNRVASAFVFNPRLDALDFLEFVLTDFGIPPVSRTKSGMLLQLNRWLIERYHANDVCVIVVDEAQNLSWDLLEEVRLLTNLETASVKLVQVVLSGQPELEQKLLDPAVRQLRQRIAFWCKTRPLDSKETTEYVLERLRIAGATNAIFSPESLAAIHEMTKGIPRIINLVCENALINAYADQLSPIPASIVTAIAEELQLGDQQLLFDRGTATVSGDERCREALTTLSDRFTSPRTYWRSA